MSDDKIYVQEKELPEGLVHALERNILMHLVKQYGNGTLKVTMDDVMAQEDKLFSLTFEKDSDSIMLQLIDEPKSEGGH